LEEDALRVIRTVLGDIKPEELGFCHTHEHMTCDQRVAQIREMFDTTRRWDSSAMILDEPERTLEEIKRFRAHGGSAMVEVTTSAWGRNLDTLARFSRESGVHIVATGGFYTEPHMPREAETMPIPDIADWIVSEVMEGVGPDRIRVGLIKSGIYHGRIAGLELKGLRAVARAQMRTGVAITTHTSGARRHEVRGGNMGAQHLRTLFEEGVDPHRFIVGHTDERPDIEFLSWLCSLGCYVQFDVIGKSHWLLNQTRFELLKELVKRGFRSHILLGTDRCHKPEFYRELGGAGYTLILDEFVPMALEDGLTQEDLDAFLIKNPANALAIEVPDSAPGDGKRPALKAGDGDV
jgi:phosphotriesterase-related protein